MLVKHNLAYTEGLISPRYVSFKEKFNFKLEEGIMYVKKSHSSFAKFLIDEGYYIDDTESKYFLGFYGELEGYCGLRTNKIYNYENVKNIENFYYIETIGEKVKQPLHVNVTMETKLKINKVGLYKGNIPDVYLPNINTLPTNKQRLLPPEGHYKEIQAL